MLLNNRPSRCAWLIADCTRNRKRGRSTSISQQRNGSRTCTEWQLCLCQRQKYKPRQNSCKKSGRGCPLLEVIFIVDGSSGANVSPVVPSTEVVRDLKVLFMQLDQSGARYLSVVWRCPLFGESVVRDFTVAMVHNVLLFSPLKQLTSVSIINLQCMCSEEYCSESHTVGLLLYLRQLSTVDFTSLGTCMQFCVEACIKRTVSYRHTNPRQ